MIKATWFILSIDGPTVQLQIISLLLLQKYDLGTTPDCSEQD